MRKNAPAGKGPNCTEATSLNMVIGKCIRRELFFQCPGMATTDSCQALVKFGKSCPMFPFHGGCKGKGDKKEEKKEKKEDKPAKKEEKKEEKPAKKEQKKEEKPAQKKEEKKEEKKPKN
jgi:hypothetical protein